VWDALASGPRRREQRELVAAAIGPIWEANHVWLILVVVLLFTCFPPVFAGLMTVLHVPLTLMLVGIVLRGSAFVFRAYDPDAGRRAEAGAEWGRTFAVASIVTPVLLGIALGAVASEEAGRALAAVEQGPAGGGFAAIYLRPWLTPFSFAVGLFALALVAFLAAVYLTIEARDEALREDFRRRAIGAAGASAALAVVVLVLARWQAPRMHAGLLAASWGAAVLGAALVSAVAAVLALAWRRYAVARIAAAAQLSCILWGWALAQFPYLVPPRLTIADSAAAPGTLRPVLWALAVGSLVLLPSLWYLFRVFKGGARGRVPESSR
jgi:cytochrome d ubiquinol oxidase subunit II